MMSKRQTPRHVAKIAWRIKPRQWGTDTQFERLLHLFCAHREVVDEIALFVGDCDASHGYEPLDDFATKVSSAARRMHQLRAEGFANIGINVWPTFGSEYGAASIGKHRCRLPFQPMVGYDGSVARSTACVNTPEFIAYTRKRFGIVAGAHPDFIWVDDDCRITHLGVPYPCFCNTCLELFDAGRWKSRHELVAALNTPENADLRRLWVEFNTASLERLCSRIENAIHEVDGDIDIGWMTVGPTHSTYSGDYVNRCGKALAGRRARPGHGYYTDDRRRHLVFKALDVGRQIREYPAEADDIQYEYEDHPCIVLDKALQTVCNEVTVAVAIGCTGVAMNTFHAAAGRLDEHEPLLARFATDRPVWDTLVECCEGLDPVGLWPADTPLLMAARSVNEQGWFCNDGGWWEGVDYKGHGLFYDISVPNEWAQVGFVLSTDPASACGTLLAGRIAEAFSDDELRRILAGAVFMDNHALEVLWKRGLGELAGVQPGREVPSSRERFTEHPLNAPFAGDERMTHGHAGWSLQPMGREVETLSHIVGIDDEDCGPCVTTYENDSGGRVVVMGHVPWTNLGMAGKLAQLRALVDWATQDRMPLMPDRPLRVTPFVRMNSQRTRFAAVLLNNGLDPTGPFGVRIRAKVSRVRLLKPSGEEVLPLEQVENGVFVKLKDLAAWQTAILVGK